MQLESCSQALGFSYVVDTMQKISTSSKLSSSSTLTAAQHTDTRMSDREEEEVSQGVTLTTNNTAAGETLTMMFTCQSLNNRLLITLHPCYSTNEKPNKVQCKLQETT